LAVRRGVAPVACRGKAAALVASLLALDVRVVRWASPLRAARRLPLAVGRPRLGLAVGARRWAARAVCYGGTGVAPPWQCVALFLLFLLRDFPSSPARILPQLVRRKCPAPAGYVHTVAVVACELCVRCDLHWSSIRTRVRRWLGPWLSNYGSLLCGLHLGCYTFVVYGYARWFFGHLLVA